MEHRWGKRSGLDAIARVVTGARVVHVGRIRNASLSGAFILVNVRLQPFTGVLVAIEGVGRNRSPVARIPAHVVRLTSEGIAVEWSELAPPAILRLLASLPSLQTNAIEPHLHSIPFARDGNADGRSMGVRLRQAPDGCS